MIRELYVEKTNEISISVTQSHIDSIKENSITKSGCRVYHNGYIGISGTFGEAKEDTWNKAIESLKNKVQYEYDITNDKKRIRNLKKTNIPIKEFVKKTEKLLNILRNECSDFVFSSKIMSIEEESVLKNDLGLDYTNIDRYFYGLLSIKHKNSLNIYDTAVAYFAREFDIEEILDRISKELAAYRNKIYFLDKNKMPIIASFVNFGSIFCEALNGKDIGEKASILNNKMAKNVFSKKFTLNIDRSADNIGVSFFDAEGSTLKNDKISLIENGKIISAYTDKMCSNKYSQLNTASSIAKYNEIPNLCNSNEVSVFMSPELTNKNLIDIVKKKDAIYIVFMESGDCTSEGEFSSLVQMSYLFRNGKMIGRLPELYIRGNIYDMFGKDYLGASNYTTCYGNKVLVINMNVELKI